MIQTSAQPVLPAGRPRWYFLSPGRILPVLLAIEGFLLLCERFCWFDLHKGYIVLIAVGVVGPAVLLLLLYLAVSLLFRWQSQFSTRSLVLLTVAVAILGGWLINEMWWAKRQRQALKEIRENDYGYYSAPSDDLHWATYWPRRVLGDDFFVSVPFVWLQEWQVTDAALEQMKGLRDLNRLCLSRTRITDAGLEHLKNLPQLQELEISHSLVTDAGLERLKELTQLRRLSISSTKITDEGAKKLQEALPNCKVTRWEPEQARQPVPSLGLCLNVDAVTPLESPCGNRQFLQIKAHPWYGKIDKHSYDFRLEHETQRFTILLCAEPDVPARVGNLMDFDLAASDAVWEPGRVESERLSMKVLEVTPIKAPLARCYFLKIKLRPCYGKIDKQEQEFFQANETQEFTILCRAAFDFSVRAGDTLDLRLRTADVLHQR